MTRPQLWLLAGGNGAGKTTFYELFLWPKNVRLVNADQIAKILNPDSSELASYEAAGIAEIIREKLVRQKVGFCYETVFSHVSKIDFAAEAKRLGYRLFLVYIHLATPALNEARVQQRRNQGGHSVPAEKIVSRIQRTVNHIKTALPLFDDARILDNSSRENPFRQIAIVKNGQREWTIEHLPDWAKDLLKDTPGV